METVPQAVWSPALEDASAGAADIVGSEATAQDAAPAEGQNAAPAEGQDAAPAEGQAVPARSAGASGETGPAVASAGQADPAGAAQPVPAPVTGAASSRIVVHYNANSRQAARQMAYMLAQAGFGESEMRPVQLSVSTTNVRYFHEENRAAAAAVAEILRAAWGQSQLKDYTDYTPSPSVGTIEIWLRG